MRCILVPKLNTKNMNKELKKYKPNLLPVVPSLLALICKGKSGSELKHVKGIFCGGDYLSIELKAKTEEYFRQRGSIAKIRIGYGLSEATAFFLATYNHIPYEASSIGIPNPDTIVKIFQVGTEIECKIINLHYTLGNNNTGQALTKLERTAADACYTVWNIDASQPFAVIKRATTNTGNTFRNGNIC